MATSDSRLWTALGSVPYLTGTAGALALAVVAAVTGSSWWLVAAAPVFLAGVAGAARPRRTPTRPTPPPVTTRTTPPARWTQPRTFSFIDDDRISGVLEQLEGGRVRDVSEQRADVVRRGLVAGVSASILSVEGRASAEQTDQTLTSLDRTPQTRFNLLHAYLTADRLLGTFDPHAESGAAPKVEQYCETVVESRDIFHPDAGREVEVNGIRTTVVCRFTEGGRTPEHEDADGEVTVMGRVSSNKVTDGRHVLIIRVFAVYQ